MLFEYNNNTIINNIKYDIKTINNINSKFIVFFNRINEIIYNINNILNSDVNNNFAIFPCNHYIQYLITFGLEHNKIEYLYDNNILKNNKILYGTKLVCKNINFFKNNNHITIILIGSIYNNEIINDLNNNNIKYIIVS